MGHNFSFCTGCETPLSCDNCLKLMNGVQEIDGNTSDVMTEDDWTIEESRKFLEKAKAIKISHCEKWGLPIPAFDKEEDYFSPEECPFCMTEKVEKSARLKLWMRAPNSSAMALWEYEANYCPMCGRKIKREKQNDT